MKTSLSKGPYLFLLLAVVCGEAGVSRAECCQLTKIEAAPPTVHVRVCASAEGPTCSQPLFDGDVAHGSPVSICSAGTEVFYQELDPATGELGPATAAACSASRNIEL
ncbi:MAG: hypothetical protein WEF50_07095 [Myxococcota bacterium]